LLKDSVWEYSYDKSGNLDSKWVRHGTEENYYDPPYFDYAWDAAGQLTATSVVYNGGTHANSWSGYDGHGRMVQHYEYYSPPGGSIAASDYGSSILSTDLIDTYSSGMWSVLARSSAHTANDSTVTNNLEYRLNGSGVDDVELEHSPSSTLWNLSDHQGSVLGYLTATGVALNVAQYDEFGNGGIIGGVGWTGRERDGVPGLQYNRARWYDPSSGQWASLDPLGFDAGDANLYRYVGNSPTNATDPSGQMADGFNPFGLISDLFSLGSGKTKPGDVVAGGAIAQTVPNAGAMNPLNNLPESTNIHPKVAPPPGYKPTAKLDEETRKKRDGQLMHWLGGGLSGVPESSLPAGPIPSLANPNFDISSKQFGRDVIRGIIDSFDLRAMVDGLPSLVWLLWNDPRYLGHIIGTEMVDRPGYVAGQMLTGYLTGKSIAAIGGKLKTVSPLQAIPAPKLNIVPPQKVPAVEPLPVPIIDWKPLAVPEVKPVTLADALAQGSTSAAEPLAGAAVVGSTESLLRMLQKTACFVAGTPIRTPDGSVAVEQLTVGDQVLSRDEHDAAGVIVAKPVEAVFVRVGPTYRLVVSGREYDGRAPVLRHRCRLAERIRPRSRRRARHIRRHACRCRVVGGYRPCRNGVQCAGR
jgi:RHS repeat-associated protein